MERSLECKIYQSELRKLGKGIPLYEPKPSPDGYHVHLGDVGYQWNGRFRSCFNIFESVHPQSFNNTFGVPVGFRALPRPVTEEMTPSAPGSVFSNADDESAGGDLQLDVWSNVSPGARFQLSVSHTKRRAALLSIRHSAEHSVIVDNRSLKDYMLENYGRWFEFIRIDLNRDIQIDDIMLVTECHLTADWATGVWTDGGSREQVGLDVMGHLAGSLFRERRTSIRIPPRYGPDPYRILSQNVEQAPQTDVQRDQCIFLKCFWVKERGMLPPKLMAAAGPHNLDFDGKPEEGPVVLSSDVWPDGEEQQQEIEPHDFALDLVLEESDAQLAIVHETDVFALAEALDHKFVKPVDLTKIRWKGKGISVAIEYHVPTGKTVGVLLHADSMANASNQEPSGHIEAQGSHSSGSPNDEGEIQGSGHNEQEAATLAPSFPNMAITTAKYAPEGTAFYSQSKQDESTLGSDQSIQLLRRELSLFPHGHPRRPVCLNSLGGALLVHFQRYGSMDVLQESISLLRAALELFTEGHPERFSCLCVLGDALMTRFEEMGRVEDLEESIVLLRAALDLCPYGHSHQSPCLRDLSNALGIRFAQSGRVSDLEESIVLIRAALDLCPDGHPYRSSCLRDLGNILKTRFSQRGMLEDLDESISLLRAALELCPEGHPGRSSYLRDLGNTLKARFARQGWVSDLEESISLLRVALELVPKGQPGRPSCLRGLGNSLRARFAAGGRLEDLEESISLHRIALHDCPESHQERSSCLHDLGNALSTRFAQSGSIDDLNESIQLLREALALCPFGHPNRHPCLPSLGFALRVRFEWGGNIDDLDESVRLLRDALAVCPQDHQNRPSCLRNLGNALSTRFAQGGSIDDLNESIRLLRDTLELCPEGHPGRSSCLHDLGNTLKVRFTQSGSATDLNESITLLRAAINPCPESHPYRSTCLRDLGSAMKVRFTQNGRIDDLEESITLLRAALNLCPESHPYRSACLRDLGSAMKVRFTQNGRIDDLEESISLLRAALELLPDGHPDRSSCLSDLGDMLKACFAESGMIEDLKESVSLLRASLHLCPESHPSRSSRLRDLGSALKVRFTQSGSATDLNESIALLRAALKLCPDGYPYKSSCLRDLGNALIIRFARSERISDMEESISLHRVALSLCPEGHPYLSLHLRDLGSTLKVRFTQSGSANDLEESIVLLHNALVLCPDGHPTRSATLLDFANILYARFEKENSFNDFEECIRALSLASSHPFSSLLLRMRCAVDWALLARRHDHSTTLAAYRTAITVLQKVVNFRPTLASRRNLLTSSAQFRTLGVDAASYAIEKGDLCAAVELSEQGRNLVWSQIRGCRAPLDELKKQDQSLAERFMVVSGHLEALVMPPKPQSTSLIEEGSTTSDIHMDRMAERVRRLSEEQEALIDEIRKLPGFESFLSPASFKKLQESASEGPVIVMNHSKFRCDALIVLARDDTPCVPVPLDKEWHQDALYLYNDLFQARYRGAEYSLEYDEMIWTTMKVLWDRVVSKVVSRLKELGITEGSRIWWCPTGCLASLPFHAAGPYKTPNGMKYLLDDYISSYTPTLTSLIVARSDIRIGADKFLFVGDTSLKSTKKELTAIRKHQHVKKCLLDEREFLGSVVGAEWAHFACPGTLDPEQVLEFSLRNTDWSLSILDIARMHLPCAEFAFLSASRSAGSVATDEGFSLAAAMQFAGFRGVVGMMWSKLDSDGPLLADAVYEHLMGDVEEGEFRFKRAAAAVRKAALLLRSQKDKTDDGREVSIPAARWVSIIHIGA